jgi:LAO/AO transport system kinase
MDFEKLVDGALQGQKYAVAQLISVFEDSRTDAPERQHRVLQYLDARSDRYARFIGITGTPGAGKSTLIGELALRLVKSDPSVRVGVVAVDPSSEVSGGALLGDRTRVRFPVGEKRLYFRSQASDHELGGVSRTTFPVCRLLHRLFDIVFIETVGIGQSEIEIQHVADFIYLVLTPLGGDQVQFMKAGIMEIPDAIILNKCDAKEAATKAYHSLRGSLSMSRPGEEHTIKVHRTSANTGFGLDTLTNDILSTPHDPMGHSMVRKENYFLEKWVRDEFGRTGLRYFSDWAEHAGAADKTFEERKLAFREDYKSNAAEFIGT